MNQNEILNDECIEREFVIIEREFTFIESE
jgi:hypothetical protein